MYVKSFFMKLVMVTIVLWIILGMFFGVSLLDILLTSVLVTVAGYIGDVFLLPFIGNVFASIGDFIFSFVLIWLLGSFIYEGPIALGTASFIAALALMMGEMYLHRYMESRIFEPRKPPEEKIGYYQRTNLLTEFAEETVIEPPKKTDDSL